MDTIRGIIGANSPRKTLCLLRIIGEHHESGLTVTELAALSGLARPTVHRMVACMVEEGFAARDPIKRNVRLGAGAMSLGFASLKRAPILDRYRPILQRVSRISGDTTFLMLRQGDFAFCIHREEGSFRVKVFSIDVGERRLLGIGVGGLAMLSQLPDEEIARIHARNDAAYGRAGLDRARLQRVVNATRRRGYAETRDTLTEGIGGVAVSFPVAPDVLAAVSIGALTSRLGSERCRELAEALKAELRGA